MKPWLSTLLLAATAVSARGEEPRQTVVDDAWQGAQGYHFSGRVTEIRSAAPEDSGRLAALYRNTRMLFTSGEEGLVTWQVAGKEWTLPADEHGYWELAGNPPLGLPPGWHEIDTEPVASSPAGLLIVDPRNPVGIISDIDDTILVTGVLKKSELLKNSLTVTPEMREAVPGMAGLYRKMLQENPAPAAAAVFYLSSGPRQLTDNLRRFLAAKGFPRGVLQLRKVAREGGEPNGDHQAFKLHHLETILAAFPQVRFHLFGDDGESDPEVYAQIQARHPDQVAGVWIHHVNPDPKRPTHAGQRNVQELLP